MWRFGARFTRVFAPENANLRLKLREIRSFFLRKEFSFSESVFCKSALPYRHDAFGMIAIALSSHAAVLSDDLSNTTTGSDVVSGDTLLAADFSTGSSSWTLSSATLLLQMDTIGTVGLDLYSDNSGIPGTLLGSLVSSRTYSSSLAAVSFTASGLTLNADTTYWLVLAASSGSFEWAWTQTNSGDGVGFTGDSAFFDGAYWYGTTGIYPNTSLQ